MLALSVAVVALTGFYLADLFRETAVDEGNLAKFATALKGFEDKAPASLLKSDGSGGYHFGRWKSPIKDLSFMSEKGLQAPSSREFVKLKRWDYMSLGDDRYFVALAMVHINYLEEVFVYAVDLANPTKKFEYLSRRPPFTLDFASSSVSGCTAHAADPFHLEAKSLSTCFDDKDNLFRISINLPLTAADGETRHLLASFAVTPQEDLVISFPLGGSSSRPAYVHKSAGMTAVGNIKFFGAEGGAKGDEGHYFDGLASIDWTKSLALRTTTWNWLSVSGRATVKTHTTDAAGKVTTETAQGDFGINLSARVYDVEGESVENGFWLNHTVYPLAGAKFELPKEPLRDQWKVVSLNGETFSLTFSPQGAREDHTNLGLVVSDFIQPFGYVSGTVKIPAGNSVVHEVIIKKVFGVVEDHYAVW